MSAAPARVISISSPQERMDPEQPTVTVGSVESSSAAGSSVVTESSEGVSVMGDVSGSG